MGATGSKTVEEELKIDDSEWQYLTIENGLQIVKHRSKDKQGEVVVTASDPIHSVHDELDIYNYRKNQDDALVQVYCAEFLKSSQATMCGNQQNVKVIYERIPYRYRDLPILPLPQAIYMLSESLRGFRECYDKVGSFQLNDRMIGVNINGEARVWLNENFAENHPSSERPVLQITVSASHRSSASKEEETFVRNFIEITRSKLEEKRFPQKLERLLKQASGFYDTYSVVERYCEDNKIWIPDRIPINSLSRVRQTRTQSRQPNSQYVPVGERNAYVPYIPNFNQQPNSVRSAEYPLSSPYQIINRQAQTQNSYQYPPSANKYGRF